jgi:hypothetical protein
MALGMGFNAACEFCVNISYALKITNTVNARNFEVMFNFHVSKLRFCTQVDNSNIRNYFTSLSYVLL